MSTVATRVLLVVEDGIDPMPIEEALPPGARVTKTRLSDAGHAWSAVRAGDGEPELVVIGCAHRHDDALNLVHGASNRTPAGGLPVVVLYHGSPNGFMEKAFAAGADDLITLPQSPRDLAFALEKAIARRRGAAPATREGALITVLGPKGGTGKTLTACNLAIALSQTGASPVIVDLDLQFGDVGLALGMRPTRTIYDLASSAGTLDDDKVESFLTVHSSGAKALLAPVRPDQAAIVSISFIRSVLEILRSRHDFVIVDTPPAFSPEVIASIDASSSLCVVGMLDALSLKDTKIGLETLGEMGYEQSDITLLLNRADSNVGISQADVEQLLGRRPDVLVPSDRAIPRALTEGRTIVDADPRSAAAKAFMQLAETLRRGQADDEGPAEDSRRGGILSRKRR